MAGQLAIVAYRALVGGLPSGEVDIQVRGFADQDAGRVRQFIGSEPASSYLNPDDEVAHWEFSNVLAIEPFDPRQTRESGEEIIGFIASTDELSGLA
jgi:hypothetical protein